MIRKAVIPVAGLGTRLLPASKAIPKEMVTVVDRPAIQYVVEEAVEAGIREVVLVTHSAKNAVEDHFDVNYELEAELEKKHKHDLLSEIRDIIPPEVRVISVRQGKALGLGHAVLCAREVIGDEPFAVLLADVLVDSPDGDRVELAAMLERFADSGKAQIMVEPVPREKVHQYGIVELDGATPEPGASVPMTGIREKPAPEDAPSRLAVVGRYVLPQRIFPLLAQTPPGAGDEIQLTDAIASLLAEQGVEAWHMRGQTHDCGSKLGFLEATLHYGRLHPELGEAFREMLDEAARKNQGS